MVATSIQQSVHRRRFSWINAWRDRLDGSGRAPCRMAPRRRIWHDSEAATIVDGKKEKA